MTTRLQVECRTAARRSCSAWACLCSVMSISTTATPGLVRGNRERGRPEKPGAAPGRRVAGRGLRLQTAVPERRPWSTATPVAAGRPDGSGQLTAQGQGRTGSVVRHPTVDEEEVFALGISNPDLNGRGPDERAEAFLATAQFLLHATALGDVHQDVHSASWLTQRIPQRAGVE